MTAETPMTDEQKAHLQALNERREELHAYKLAILEVYHSIVAGEAITPEGKLVVNNAFFPEALPVVHLLYRSYEEMLDFLPKKLPLIKEDDAADFSLRLETLYDRRAPFLLRGIFLLRLPQFAEYLYATDGAFPPRVKDSTSAIHSLYSEERCREDITNSLTVIRGITHAINAAIRGECVTPDGTIYDRPTPGSTPILHLLYRDRAFLDSFFKRPDKGNEPEPEGHHYASSVIRGLLYLTEQGDHRKTLMRGIMVRRHLWEVLQYLRNNATSLFEGQGENSIRQRAGVPSKTILNVDTLISLLELRLKEESESLLYGMPYLSTACSGYLSCVKGDGVPKYGLFPSATRLPKTLPEDPTSYRTAMEESP